VRRPVAIRQRLERRRSSAENLRSTWARGKAILTIVVSSTTMSWASPTTSSTSQRRTGPDEVMPARSASGLG